MQTFITFCLQYIANFVYICFIINNNNNDKGKQKLKNLFYGKP